MIGMVCMIGMACMVGLVRCMLGRVQLLHGKCLAQYIESMVGHGTHANYSCMLVDDGGGSAGVGL